MKKNILLITSAFFLMIFTGCYNEVFYDIRGDVKPESATISGNINSLTRYTVGGKEFLVLFANNGIRYKSVENGFHDAWLSVDTDSLPFEFHSYEYFSEEHEGEQVIKILADETTLYIVTVTYENNYSLGTTVPAGVKLYGVVIPSYTEKTDERNDETVTLHEWTMPPASAWTKILDDSDGTYFPIYNYSTYYYTTAFNIFQTNAPQAAHRKVYIRRGSPNASTDYQTVTYYELSGTSDPTAISATPIDPYSDTSTNCINSAAWFNGEVLFFNSQAVTTNETYDDEATRFYYATSSTVYHSEEGSTSISSETLSAGEPVSALAVCSDALLIGRANYSATSYSSSAGGLKKTTLTDSVPGTSLVDFGTNASFQISTAYFVLTLINATPGESELESDLYASISYVGTGTSTSVSSKNIGLWSYYPARGNWNRE